MTYSFDDWRSGKPYPKSGWDAADCVENGWSKDDLDAYMRATVRRDPPPPTEPRKEVMPDKTATKPDQDGRDTRSRPHIDSPGRGQSVSAGATRELRTTEQAVPATVTDIKTRKSYAPDDSWRTQLVCNEAGNPKPGVTKNWGLFLENHPDTAGLFAWDNFKLRVCLTRCPPWEDEGSGWVERGLMDKDLGEAVMWLESNHMTPKQSNIAGVIQTIAERNKFDRLDEYLNGLEWDRKPRAAQFMADYLGVEADAYASAVSLRWLISSVARGLRPGCKVDTMPILEGPQGARKSTALRVLYGDEFFADELSDIGSKDAMMEMQGVWGLEIAEMHRFSAAETNAVKKFLTRQTDRFRPPYGRTVVEAPRRVVLNGTINPEGNAYLRDPTGARRFWPVEVGKIDVDRIAEDRDQIWAEAVYLFLAGSQWWLNEGEVSLAVVEQEKRTDVDVWMDVISGELTGKKSITQMEIFKALGLQTKDIDYRHAGRVGRVMKKLGWGVVRSRAGGEDRTIYRAPDYNDWARAMDGEF